MVFNRQKYLAECRDEAYSNEIEDVELKIYGSDIDEEAIKIAKNNAEQADLADVIEF